MKKPLLYTLVLAIVAFLGVAPIWGNQLGDTLTIDGKKYKLLSNNLIANPGFENDFTGWTDATTSAATLTSAKFSVSATGGVNNSKYLIGLTNENSSSSGSIGTGWPITAGKSYLIAYQVKYLNAATSAGAETYLKISLTNDKTSSAEPKVLINNTQVNGGGAWTQNYLFFTNADPNYNFVVARFRWLNNRFGFDDFMLYEAVEVVNNAALQNIINEALTLYNPDANGAVQLQSAITVAEGYLTSSSSTEITKAIADLQTAIQNFKYANASDVNPLDMTHFITNADFIGNASTGWQGIGTVNNSAVEFYQKTFDMYQVINGLPAGKYRLKAKGFERPKLNDSGSAYNAGTETIYARLYAQSPNYSETNIPFNSLYKHSFTGSGSLNGYINTMAGAEIVFTGITTNTQYLMTLNTILLDEGGTLTIGAKTSFQQNGYWVLFDNFRLEYLGSSNVNDYAIALQNRIGEAQSLLLQQMQQSAIAAINAAILQAQAALSANPLVNDDILVAKTTIDAAINGANISIKAYKNLQKAISDAQHILSFLEKENEITTLQNAIQSATTSYNNPSLTLAQINDATASLITVTRSVGKQIYVPTWMMGDVYNPQNNWSIERSKQSKNWILFWEPGFGEYPGSVVDECLALAEKSFDFYADSLKFIQKGASKTDTYKMIIRLRYSTEWEASGSGVDNTIGLLTLTSWALSSRGGQTIAHEVGHCFQYQVHCDNNDMNGWMYGFGENASGGNGWWEQCAQWQAYKIFPNQQFTNEWFSGYQNNVHKHILHESPRYNNFFIQDFWSFLHGKDIIGRLWNKSYKPEDPVETYKRITGINQNQFNDQMWQCGARFATWDIPALKTLGASTIASRPQPKLNNQGNFVWRIDATVCLENYGHNIIKLNAPTTSKTVTAYFEGLAGIDGYRKNYLAFAGWRFGFVALLKDGTRVYSDIQAANISVNSGKASLNFNCPDNCDRLWLVVSGAPLLHYRHAWDDNDTNDEQWPYQVSFNNTNLLGYTNVVTAVNESHQTNIDMYAKNKVLYIKNIQQGSSIQVYNMAGICLLNQTIESTAFSKELSKGLYVVTVTNSNGKVSEKILVH